MSNKDVDDLMIIKIPLFRCVCNVIVDETGIMKWTCSEYECTGIFCVHQICVAQFVHNFSGLDFTRLDHHDIGLWHNSAYLHLANRIETPNLLQNLLIEYLNMKKQVLLSKLKFHQKCLLNNL